MKILHLLKSDRFSGAEHVVCDIVDLFREDPDCTMVYCSTDGPIRQTLEEKEIPFFGMSKFGAGALRRILAEVQPDLIHAHDFSASVLAAGAFQGPVVSHLHSNPLWAKKPGPKTQLYRLAAHKFTDILVVSDAIRQEFYGHVAFDKKVRVLGNPFDASRIRTLSENGEGEETDLLFLGRMNEAKDPAAFVETVALLKKQFPQIRACMIGDGGLSEPVREEIRTRGLSESVRMTGFLENPYPEVKKTKVLFMPSRFEGFGLAALEAMALGKPVVCSGVGGLKDIVDDSCGAVCGSIEAYAETIGTFLSDPALYREKSDGALRRAEEQSNLKAYKEALKRIYAHDDRIRV